MLQILASRSKFLPEISSFGMRIAYTGLAFLITVVLARLLGPTNLGKYFEVAAWVLLVLAFIQSGWTPFLVREIAALREGGNSAALLGVIWTSTRIVGTAALVAAAMVVLIAYAAGTDAETMRVLVIAALMIPLLATSTIRQAVTRGMGRPLLGQICENLSRPAIQLIGLLCLWIGLARADAGPAAAMTIFLVAVGISAGIAFAIERRTTHEVRSAKVVQVRWQPHWPGSFFRNALIGWSSAVNLQIGTILLARTVSDAQVADFRIAQQLSLLMTIGLAAVATLYAPELSRSFARKDYRTLQILATRASLFSIVAALPLALLYFIFGESFVYVVFGSQYSGSYAPLVVLTIGQLASAFFGLSNAIAIATHREAIALKSQLIGAACNVVITLLLVSRLGPLGAALGSAAALIISNVPLFVHIQRNFGISTVFLVTAWKRHEVPGAAPADTSIGNSDVAASIVQDETDRTSLD